MIRLVIPSIPPSVNHAYAHRGKNRFLTKVGRAYKNETIAHIAENYRKELMIFRKDARYQIFFRFNIGSIQNMNWKPNSSLNRYKKFDGGNLTKLLEDCIASAGGIDDSQTMISLWQKKATLGPETTVVWVWNLDDEHDPFDLDFALDHLR